MRRAPVTLVVAMLCLSASALAQNTRCQPSGLHIRLVYEKSEQPVRGHFQIQIMAALGGATDMGRTADGEGTADFTVPSHASYRVKVSVDIGSDVMSPSFEIACNERDHYETIHIPQPTIDPGLAPKGSETVSAVELNVPESARKELDKGTAALAKNEIEAARKHFEKAIQIYPKFALAHNDLGVVCMKTGDKENGRSEFKKSLELDPHLFNGYMNLGRLALNEHDSEHAAEYFSGAVRVNPKDPEAYMLLAGSQMEIGKFAEAADSARRVHLLGDQKFAIAHMMAARSFRVLHQPDDAAKEYEAYIREAPASPMTERAQRELAQLRARNPIPDPPNP